MSADEQPQRGRPAIATSESVAKAAAELTAEGFPVTVRGVMRKIGGSPKKVGDLIKLLPQDQPKIRVEPELPDVLVKVWKQALESQAKAVQDEYEWRLEQIADDLRSARAGSTELEAELAEKDGALKALQAEHGVLHGRLQAERELREACQRELAAARKQCEQLSIEAAAQRERADMAFAQAAAAEQRAADAQRELDAARREAGQLREAKAKLEGQIDGSSFRDLLEGASSPPHAQR
jgi:chromosome segregation ATPase